MEFPELKGHSRRDYWMAIIREILCVHRFIRKYQITSVEREESLLKAILGIVRVHAIKEMSSTTPLSCEPLLMFNVCDQLPGGDLILETLANMSTTRSLERTNSPRAGKGMYSISASAMASNLGFVFGTSADSPTERKIVVGEIAVGGLSPLEKAVKESRSNYKKVVLAKATVDGVKVDGIDTNLAVMKVVLICSLRGFCLCLCSLANISSRNYFQFNLNFLVTLQELLSPVVELGNRLLSLLYWEDPLRSSLFCLVFTYIICR